MGKIELGEIGKIIKCCVICHAGEIIYDEDIEEAETIILSLIEKCKPAVWKSGKREYISWKQFMKALRGKQ